MRDGGGAGGGKGCSKGAPYGRCRLTAGSNTEALGTDEETCEITVAGEVGRAKNEGFTRLVARLVLLWDSETSRKGTEGAVANCG